MTNPTSSSGGSTGESTSKTDLAQQGARHTLRTAAILLVAVLVLAGGGWWANQNGLLSQWLPSTAQTASSVAAGVQAQTGQTSSQASGSSDPSALQATGVQTSTVSSGRGVFSPNGQPPADGQFPPGGPQAGGVLTGTVPGGSGAPAGFPPNGQAPPQETGSAATDAASGDAASVAAVSETAAAPAGSAAASTAAETGASTNTALNLAAVPAVAGVKGSQLYDGSGALLGTLEAGDSVLVTGRSDDSAWLAATTGAGIGWVQADQLIAYGLYRLPVVALPTAVAAIAADAVTSAVPVTAAQAVSLPLTAAAPLTATAAVTGAVASTDAAVASPAASADTPAGAAVTAAAVTATVVTDDGRLNLRDGPGTAYTIVGKGQNGDVYPVLGRNEAGDWLQLQLEDGETAWASAGFLEVAGDVSALPLQAAPAPTAQASAAQPAANEAAGSIATDDASAVALVSNMGAAAASTSASSAGSASAAGGGLTGTLVFQQSPGGMIYAYDLQTGDLWPLTNGFDPAISPDGSTVAFVRDGGETGLYLINIDGSSERRIFERAALSSPKWSSDGQWIVFTRNDEGVECYQMGPKMCILPDEAKKRFPMGVPDTMPLVTEYQYKLSAVDLNGGNYHDVPSLNSARAADWSDAGIVYQSSAGIQITADTGNDTEDATTVEVAFDNLNPYYYDPDLQPGGGQVVFQIKGAAQTDLWAVNTDGSGLHALTKPRTTLVDTLPSNVAAAFSPDGQHIVFLSNRTDSGEAGDWQLWVMNADGSDQRQLPVDVAIDYTYGDDQVVSWGA